MPRLSSAGACWSAAWRAAAPRGSPLIALALLGERPQDHLQLLGEVAVVTDADLAAYEAVPFQAAQRVQHGRVRISRPPQDAAEHVGADPQVRVLPEVLQHLRLHAREDRDTPGRAAVQLPQVPVDGPLMNTEPLPDRGRVLDAEVEQLRRLPHPLDSLRILSGFRRHGLPRSRSSSARTRGSSAAWRTASTAPSVGVSCAAGGSQSGREATIARYSQSGSRAHSSDAAPWRRSVTVIKPTWPFAFRLGPEISQRDSCHPVSGVHTHR